MKTILSIDGGEHCPDDAVALLRAYGYPGEAFVAGRAVPE